MLNSGAGPDRHPATSEPWRAAKFPPDDADLPDVPDMPDDPPGGGAGGFGGSDDDAIRKINQRTSPFGRLVAVVLVGGAVALGWTYYQRSQRYDARMAGLEAAGALEGDAMLAAIRSELEKAEFDDVKERALRNLGHFRDTAAVPLMIAALDEPGPVRRTAAWALARIGTPGADPAKDALLRVLPSTDASDRAQVVWTLAVLKESRAGDAILQMFTEGRLQDMDDFDPRVISQAIGIEKLGTREMTGHPQKPVRVLVAEALSEAANAEAVEPLIRMLEDADGDVVRSAALGLTRAGDPRAAQPLFDLLARKPDMRSTVMDGIKKTASATAIARLYAASTDAATKAELLAMIAAAHDPAAADTLATALASAADEDAQSTAALGLAAIGDARALPALAELARSTDRTIAIDAIDAIRSLGKPDVNAALVAVLGEFPDRKAAILRALGASGDAAVGSVIERELGSDDVEAAAQALGELRYEPAYRRIREMIKRPRNVDFSTPSVSNELPYRNRTMAVRALAWYGRPDPAADLMVIVEDPQDDLRLREEAAATLGRIANADIIGQVLGKVRNPDLDPVARRAYVAGLWQRPSPETATALMPMLVSDAAADLRRAAALAIGYVGDPANDERLVTLLEAESTRRDAAFATILGGGEAPARKLVATLIADRDLREIVQGELTNRDSDLFDRLAPWMFESGAIWRRIRTAQILQQGEGDNRYGYAWAKLVARLSRGWDGPGGVSARFVRDQLREALGGTDAARRALAAEMLASMQERGILLSVRDGNAAGADEARNVLRAMTRTPGVN